MLKGCIYHETGTLVTSDGSQLHIKSFVGANELWQNLEERKKNQAVDYPNELAKLILLIVYHSIIQHYFYRLNKCLLTFMLCSSSNF